MPRPDSIPDFNRAASTYADAARIQGLVADDLLNLLPEINPPERILEAGCGSGLLTEKLVRRFPESRVDAFDAALRMVAEVRRRFPAHSRVHAFVADMRKLRRTSRYDLVISSSAIHWLHPMPPGLRRLAAALRPGGLFAAAMMTEGTLTELHATRKRIAPEKQPPGLPAVSDILEAFQSAGLNTIRVETVEYRSRHESADALLAALKAMGVTGGRFSRGAAPLSRGEIRRLVRDYESVYREPDGDVRATWCAVLILATLQMAT